jgi:hypothetical protein
VSTGQASPPDFWYDQDVGEWVLLLSGAAEIRFEDEAEPRKLIPGDWITIEAHRRHRVNWTDPLTADGLAGDPLSLAATRRICGAGPWGASAPN